MSGVQIVQSLQLVLQNACPDANVILGIPKQFHDPILLYLWRDGPPTDVKKTTDTVSRFHAIHVHLLVQSVGDDQAAELLYLDLSERVNDAYQQHMRLLGMAATSTLATKSMGSQYVLIDSGEYRACGWVWTAEERLSFVFA